MYRPKKRQSVSAVSQSRAKPAEACERETTQKVRDDARDGCDTA
jgi:hypothetical protein